MHKLKGPRPAMQPGSLFEGEHEGVYRGDQEVKAQRPKCEVGEEAERLADGGLALLDLVRADIDIFQSDGRSIGCEPAV